MSSSPLEIQEANVQKFQKSSTKNYQRFKITGVIVYIDIKRLHRHLIYEAVSTGDKTTHKY